MACIVKQKRKGTNTVYAYESESYWVPGIGPRCKRKLIGKVDPITGEIIPTGKRGRPPKTRNSSETDCRSSSESKEVDDKSTLDKTKQSLIEAIAINQQQEDKIGELMVENRVLRDEIQNLQTQMGRMKRTLEEARLQIMRSFDTCISTCKSDIGEPPQ